MKLLGIVALASVVLAATVASAQSLAEVARQEEARRKAIKSAGKVYTNDSVRPAPQPATPPATPTTAPAAREPKEAATPTSPGVQAVPGVVAPAAAQGPRKDEAYWRNRVQAARDALGRAETFAEALQTRINVLSADFTNRDDPAQRTLIATNRDKALAELERVTREIQQFTKAIVDIQEEARRAGAPAGWVR